MPSRRGRARAAATASEIPRCAAESALPPAHLLPESVRNPDVLLELRRFPNRKSSALRILRITALRVLRVLRLLLRDALGDLLGGAIDWAVAVVAELAAKVLAVEAEVVAEAGLAVGAETAAVAPATGHMRLAAGLAECWAYRASVAQEARNQATFAAAGVSVPLVPSKAFGIDAGTLLRECIPLLVLDRLYQDNDQGAA